MMGLFHPEGESPTWLRDLSRSGPSSVKIASSMLRRWRDSERDSIGADAGDGGDVGSMIQLDVEEVVHIAHTL